MSQSNRVKPTKAQQQSILRLWKRMRKPLLNDGRKLSYRAFRKTAQHGSDCIMILWCDMWLGIETDGYTHS